MDVMENVRKRTSCRSYDGRALSKEDRAELERRIPGCLGTPFGADIRLILLESGALAGKKLGTYGVIHSAALYVAGIVKPGAMNVEGLGYGMEWVVLEAADMGLSTCWLAGTYNHADFHDAAKLASDEKIVCVSPVGYPTSKRTALDRMMRGVVGSAKRKDWDALFFDGTFDVPLAESAAGDYRDALEAVRLAPSGSNGQPWRVVKRGKRFDFYCAAKPGNESGRVDMGIAACHFELVARQRGLAGEWSHIEQASSSTGSEHVYFASWTNG